MIDSVQLILLIVIVILTVLLVVLGIQVFFILRDLRKTLNKTNKVLDNANSITENIDGPLEAIASLVGGVKGGSFFAIVKLIKNFIGKDKDDEKKPENSYGK